jgi:hypothetical protein
MTTLRVHGLARLAVGDNRPDANAAGRPSLRHAALHSPTVADAYRSGSPRGQPGRSEAARASPARMSSHASNRSRPSP